MALQPGPMQVVHNYVSSRDEVLNDLKQHGFWPPTCLKNSLCWTLRTVL